MNKIKIILIVAIFLSIASCNQKNSQEKKEETSDKLVLIDLGDSLTFNWNVSSDKVVDDSLLKEIKKDFKTKQAILIEKVNDRTLTNISICGSDQKFKKGDLAFLLLKEIMDIKYYKDLYIQVDLFTRECPYPDGLFTVIENQRSFIIERIKNLN